MDDGTFSIKTVNREGVIWQNKPVDREKIDKYDFLLYAYDANDELVEEVLDFTIQITDANDNRPVFDKKSLFGNVSEEASIGIELPVRKLSFKY